jgi:hypothetical protein
LKVARGRCEEIENVRDVLADANITDDASHREAILMIDALEKKLEARLGDCFEKLDADPQQQQKTQPFAA